MKHNKIELLVYGENLKNVSVRTYDKKLSVLDSEPNFSGKYLFVSLEIAENIEPGNYTLFFTGKTDTQRVDFSIYKRETAPENHEGFSSSDIIYLITPDRFANGDKENDKNPGGAQNQYNRKNGLARHGGDIAGIIKNLDYISELGVTAIWINPLLENNMPISYHGYAATDLYKIDPRFGSNILYKQLVDKAHKRNIKIIYDHVSNHVGINHVWVKNPPCKDWFHGTPENHLPAMHDKMAPFDIYADSSVIKYLYEGWFVNEMPDLNQKNKHVANYLVQNLIWWIEFAGLDGIREDTYAYVNQEFLAKLVKEIKSEYPHLEFVGEVWTGEPEFLATYMKNNKFGNEKTELNVITDFAFRDGLAEFLRNGNLYPLYNTIAKDYIYAAENKRMIFADNHDVPRIAFLADGNTQKIKSAFILLFTMRGIPQMLYGDEIGMRGGEEHGEIRSDFPGGWTEDKRNAFTRRGRTSSENEIFDFVKSLISLRKNHTVFADGKLIHFPPHNNVYFYFRTNEKERFLVIVNGNNFGTKPDFALLGKNKNFSGKTLYDAFSGNKITPNEIYLKPFEAKVLRIL